MAIDMMTLVNLVLSLVVFVMGVWVFMKIKNAIALYVAVGFGFFAVSHFLTLEGMGTALASPLAVLRVLGYMSIVLGLFIAVKQTAAAKAPAKKRK